MDADRLTLQVPITELADCVGGLGPDCHTTCSNNCKEQKDLEKAFRGVTGFILSP